MVRRKGVALFGRRTRAVALCALVSLVFSGAVADPAGAQPKKPAPAKPPAVSPGPSVRGVKPLPTRFSTPQDDAKDSYRPTRTAWPQATTAEVKLPSPAAGARTGAKARAGKTPVWVQPVAGAKGYAGPAKVSTRVLDRSAAEAAGIPGVLLTVSPTTAGRGTLRVGVDYGGFAEAYGGNYGLRLRLMQLPACVLSTPQVEACRTPAPLPSINDAATKTVSADVTVDQPASRAAAGSAAAAGAVVLAAAADPGEEGGKGGTYAATELKPSGSWTAGGSTGSFTYSYPITLPPAASGLAPTVSLSYDSGSVDGQTASTNAQASWVGDGWSTPRSYIEQTFASCMDEPGGSASPVKTSDRCYDGPVLTLSLNGSTSSLVWDKTKSVWKPQRDNGEVITHVTNSGNGSGTYNTDYWRVTTRDGTAYEFGRNRLPGWASGKAETLSVDYSPVYSPHEGDPCYDAAGFASSVCTMAYRWNLDYVTDTHGNAMSYFYKRDINYYGRNKGATDVAYIRDSHLDHIDYGFTAGNAYGTPPNRIVFNTADRCLSGTCQPLNSTNKANWPDVPFDLICEKGTDCKTWSPSFFSTVRLTSITVQQYNTVTSAYEPVDSYALAQSMPSTGDGTSPTLWLNSITRTGHDTSAGGSTESITLPSVSFTGIKLANRVDTAGGLPNFYRQRVETVTTETGARTTASYELPEPCTAPVTVSPASNTRSCYPVYWTPEGYTDPIKDWFNKYAVTAVTTTDPTGGAPALVTSYEYLGGAAWRYDENEVVKAKYRTYGQFRGYGKVRTRTGNGTTDRRTLAEDTFYRGMSKNNNTTVVNVTDSAGGKHEDLDELAGKTLESTAYLGDGGPVDHSTVSSYWVSAPTASRTRTGLSTLTARWTAEAQKWTRQALTGDGETTWRYTQTDSSYDATVTSPTVGLPQYTYVHTVPADAAYDQCTSYRYAPVNSAKNLVGLVAGTETVSVACGGFKAGSPATVPGSLNTLSAPASVNRPAQVVKSELAFYDDPAFKTTFPQTTAPTKGDVTMTRKADDWKDGAYTYLTTARSVYDSYGRVVDQYDAKGYTTHTEYTTNAVGLTTATKATNPLGHAISTTFSTRRGLQQTGTDPNGVVTTQRYDALGRLTSVWLNSRTTSAAANYTFAYTVSKTDVTGTVSRRLNDVGGYEPTVVIYDALLRQRQTQTPTPKSGRLVTDTFYDSHGWTRATYNGWWDPATTPTLTTPVSAVGLPTKVPNQTFTTYDGLGRAVIVDNAQDGITVSTTATAYNGDRTTVIPPDGGVIATTVTDPLGRTSQLHEYSAPPTLNAPADTFTGIFAVTGGTAVVSKYGYDERGNQATLTDAGSNTWTSTYNLLGQVVKKVDPDAGTSTMSYDANGNLTQTTDGRGKVMSYRYDELNRKTAQYAAAEKEQTEASRRATWVYDNTNNAVADMTYPIGQLTTTIAYRNGQAYTSQQKGFNVFGKPLGVTLTIPSIEGSLAGTYTFTHTYTEGLGLPDLDFYPAKGGLPAEAVAYGYTGLMDLPKALDGLTGYAEVVYDAWSRPSQQVLGSTKAASITNTYDPHTGRLTEQLVSRSTGAPTSVDKQIYRYDKVGNILAKASTRLGASTPSETQCYGYDKLARLTGAWTATDDCAATPTSANHDMVGNSIAGSAYWTSWEHDPLGNRTKQVEHSLSGNADVTTGYAYDNPDQPHTLTGTTASGGAAASTSYQYDSAGNTTSRTTSFGTQTLTWDEDGKLASATGGAAGDTSYLYDPDGNLLLQREPGTTTLYLPGQQLVLNTKTGTVTGTRYYALPGGGTAIRTGTAAGAFTFALADHQGTPTLYLDPAAQNPTWRQYTPYGGERGPAITAPDNRGFLNKPQSTATNLIIVGARAYDPTLGRFISIDPVIAPEAPQQWNGYTYAGSNPVTHSDPSGKCMPEICGTPEAIKEMGKDSQNAQKMAKEYVSKGGTGSGRRGDGPGGHKSLVGAAHGPGYAKLPVCTVSTGAAGYSWNDSCGPAGTRLQGVKDHLRWIIDAANEAGIDPRLVIAILIIEGSDDRGSDGRASRLPNWARKSANVLRELFGKEPWSPPSIGMANMQEAAFTETARNHPELTGGADSGYMWARSAFDNQLSIRAAAFRLRDLMDMQPEHKGDGKSYSREEVAAIGYNVEPMYVKQIAAGTYAQDNGRSTPMGDVASNYLQMYHEQWPVANKMVCGWQVLAC